MFRIATAIAAFFGGLVWIYTYLVVSADSPSFAMHVTLLLIALILFCISLVTNKHNSTTIAGKIILSVVASMYLMTFLLPTFKQDFNASLTNNFDSVAPAIGAFAIVGLIDQIIRFMFGKRLNHNIPALVSILLLFAYIKLENESFRLLLESLGSFIMGNFGLLVLGELLTPWSFFQSMGEKERKQTLGK